MRAFLALVALFVGGCVSTESAYLSNGLRVVRISCALSSDSLTPCYKTAGDICGPRGYAIYDWGGEPWPKPYPEPDSEDYQGTLKPVTLLVACRPLPTGA